MSLKQEDLKELRDSLQKIVGQINYVLPTLHQLIVDVSVIEKYFDIIDIELLPKRIDSIETATLPQQVFKPSTKQTLTDLTMILARNLELTLKKE